MLLDPNRQQSMGQGLLNFLGSPQSMAMAQGLLAGSAPSMTQPVTFGGALGQGLGAMQKRGDIERQAKLLQEKFEEQKLMDRAKLEMQKAMMDAKIKAQAEGRQQNLTGLPQEYASLERLGEIYGYNSDVYQNAKKALDVRLSGLQNLQDYRSHLNDTMDKRTSTPLGKYQHELEDIKEGWIPGTGRTQPIQTQEEQQRLLDQYELMQQKTISNPKVAERTLFAKNIDKTLENIDIDALTQYGGAQGTFKKTKEEAKAIFGQESEEYRKHVESIAAAKLLAKQMRQFYGDSISPSVKEDLEMLTNPASWKNNPEIAKRAFNRIKTILEQEQETFREGLKSTKPYQKSDKTTKKPTEYSDEELLSIINGENNG